MNLELVSGKGERNEMMLGPVPNARVEMYGSISLARHRERRVSVLVSALEETKEKPLVEAGSTGVLFP